MIDNNFLTDHKKNIAITTSFGINYKYDDVYNFSKKFKKVIKPRSLVFCLSNNSAGSLIGYLCFIANKTPPLLLESEIDKKKLDSYISIYDPKYIWVGKSVYEKIDGRNILLELLDYYLIERKVEKKYTLNNQLALLLTTSGSTGSPKLVRISYENLQSNAESISKYLNINQSDKPITSLPMHYSFGLSVINSHIIKGATILLTDHSIMKKQFWTFLRSQNATSISGVPYTFSLLKKLKFFRMDLPRLKTLTQAGGRLDNNLILEFAKFCIGAKKKLIVMYGQTEASPRMSYLPDSDIFEKLGSIGIAIPGGKFTLIDKNGDLIKDENLEGELIYEGRNVSLGYARCAKDLKNGDENKGVLSTGDIAKRDRDGYYYIVGRKKRFIKLFGNRVNLDETEKLLKNIVQDCACLGKDDEMVIYTEEKNKNSDIKYYLSKKLGIHSSAFKTKYIGKIPKNLSGKTLYAELK